MDRIKNHELIKPVRMAAGMLTISTSEIQKPKYKGLREKLVMVDVFCFRQGGRLVSRQVVAMIVADWTIANQKAESNDEG